MVIKFLNKKGQEFEIDCGEDEILLQAGLRNGILLPYECSTGTCGSCKALAKPGTVNVNEKDLDGFKNVYTIRKYGPSKTYITRNDYRVEENPFFNYRFFCFNKNI